VWQTYGIIKNNFKSMSKNTSQFWKSEANLTEQTIRKIWWQSELTEIAIHDCNLLLDSNASRFDILAYSGSQMKILESLKSVKTSEEIAPLIKKFIESRNNVYAKIQIELWDITDISNIVFQVEASIIQKQARSEVGEIIGGVPFEPPFVIIDSKKPTMIKWLVNYDSLWEAIIVPSDDTAISGNSDVSNNELVVWWITFSASMIIAYLLHKKRKANNPAQKTQSFTSSEIQKKNKIEPVSKKKDPIKKKPNNKKKAKITTSINKGKWKVQASFEEEKKNRVIREKKIYNYPPWDNVVLFKIEDQKNGIYGNTAICKYFWETEDYYIVWIWKGDVLETKDKSIYEVLGMKDDAESYAKRKRA